ncbi:MAG: LysR family transcriptional regulator [Weizmannia coagulans]|uniref:LysR family transcriptional regulator n=1 Tax=Heyndrickxia TaxID=2837504 RepID=UPI0005536406|nr:MULTISPECIES: LysR family transcriptional regulator [Heyndrickxia]KGT37542.1 LysR family transcriptional regulator [Heyndrickxia coagulans P38]MCI1576890.1 LysR family transcriptional regulator [Heyndrickxia coagulans]MED4320067.1 LysR family transcriptional regulator [Weizmannia sp. CD-2023]MED4839167.1 LysR family transcriptional regulator [Weizmannia sp. CD-2023]MED4901059.1 LysR family transcriptional regulator [Weizmannia sp. CD-2023]
MDIQHLQYFVSVATHGSFTKAARECYVSQPTISKMIKSFEEELGVPLFNRAGKKIVLTDAGQAVFQQAQKTLKAFRQLTDAINDVAGLKKGKIRIGLPPMIGSRYFPRVIDEFHHAYPDIKIQLVEDVTRKVVHDVENGTLDLGAVVMPVDDEVFGHFSFVHDRLVLLVHPSHRLAGCSSVRLKQLKEEEFIFFHRDFALHDQIIKECLKLGFMPNIIYESTQWDLICELVASNLGVALLPSTICHAFNPERVKIIHLEEPVLPWNLAIIWPKHQYLSFAVKEWIRFTKNLFGRGIPPAVPQPEEAMKKESEK